MCPKQKRSRNGCATCRVRKVKCDEKQPKCTECTRLHRVCTWSRGEVPSSHTFRAFGPVKIAPAPSKSVVPENHQTEATAVVPSHSQLEWSNYIVSDMGSGPDELWDGLDVDVERLEFVTSPNDMVCFQTSQDFDSCLDFTDLEQLFTNDTPSNHQISDSIPSMSPGPSLPDYHIPLPNSLTLSPYKHEALKHYQTTYSLYRTTKDPDWSTHRVLLRIGSQDTMIMHLLLAVSINDYCLRRRHSAPSREAESHFQSGAQLLIGTMKTGTESDVVVTMAAFFFIYLYMSKRKSTTPQRLNQLSLTVSDFVLKQDLVACCISPLPLPGQSPARRILSSHKSSLLARLIMWTLDEDVKCSFQGTGGHLARYLAMRSAKTKDIYDASRNALGDHWGIEYPHSQALDDDQNSTVLEFLWAMMPLWQDINDLSQDSTSAPSELKPRIEQKFILLQEKYSSVFRHSSETTRPRPRILVNADYDVVLFNALQVYYFRCTITDLGAKTPSEIECSLETILTIIQRTFDSRSTDLHDRLQWPLFLAGIETSNGIYREWIFSRLSSDHVATALQNALDAQSCTGKRLCMAEIRDLLYSSEEPSLLESSIGFLDNITTI